MNKTNFIYLRGLKHAENAVFCVENGQKSYYDPQFGFQVPYSSGQQVKRSILSSLTEYLGVEPSPTTFVFDIKEKALGEGEVLSICDPTYPDQLLGGWMRAVKEGKERTVKRRSPLSISSMHPLHSLLVYKSKENITFDRSDRPEIHKVKVRDAHGNELSEAQINELLSGTDRSLLRKWIPDNYRATGLFIYDIAIDLRTLFCVSTNQYEPEISKEMCERLAKEGWVKSRNAFGECFVLPKEEREKIIPALAKALINWRITSNQARTFSLMETLAIAISDNANTLPAAIRAKLIDDGEKQKAKPIVDETAGADLYVTLPCSGYIVTECESADALQKAEEKLIEMMSSFDYENQIN
ncbi:MAG: CRISPR-associated protein Cas7 [Paludibacteraceae bacterium]|nr:CRISPR-associated protein Cas7 [Paludibacteraceae bacterium]